jgi:hypothetical protein
MTLLLIGVCFKFSIELEIPDLNVFRISIYDGNRSIKLMHIL